ncbi:MAG: pantoate kinase [Candidatus Hydrothermarchaeota archaeon]|nr:pantoate kinase [Candidatus Hydrothermarchaeota archaeon]
MKARAFVPGHITGFFEICEDKDMLHTGSRGCGVVVSKGVYTTVKAKKASKNEVHVYINDKPCDCPVTTSAVEEVLKLVDEKYRVEVFHKLQLPMKYGFGLSAAGSLGAVLAAASALNLNFTLNDCGSIAHCAEVANKTGLGDVIAECTGGVVLRKKPGAPGIGRIDKIPCNESVVAFIVGGELESKSILLSRQKKRTITQVGRECMDTFLKNPSVENFMRLSKKFASEAELMDKKVYSAVKQLEKRNIEASMIMLGNSIFTLTKEPEKVCKLLDFEHVVMEIDNAGARIL